jgi:hypothetical protein
VPTTVQRREERPVAAGRAVVGGQPHVGRGAAHLVPRRDPGIVEGGAHPVQVTRVGHHDHRTTPADQGRRDGLRDGVRPALARRAGQGGQGGTRRPAGGEVREERGTAAVRRPGGAGEVPGRGRSRCGAIGSRLIAPRAEGRIERRSTGGRRIAHGRTRPRQTLRPARGRGIGRRSIRRRASARRLLRPRVPRRHRQPQHVGEGAGVVVGHRARQPRHRGAQHRLGGDHPAQRQQVAVVLGLGHPFQQVAVDVLRAEAHLDPHARTRVGVHGGGHQVLEGAVQVRRRQLHRHPGHRQVGGRLDLDVPRPGTAARRPRGGAHGPGVGQAGEGRLLRDLRHAGQASAARSASTRSVRSQVNSGRSRPKCP